MKVFPYVVGGLAGLIVGFALGIILMVPKTRIGPETVHYCRRMMHAIHELPDAENARFWRITRGNPALSELWEVREAIANVRLPGEKPENPEKPAENGL